MQQKQADLKAKNVRLIVVAEQDVTADEALTALGQGTDVPILIGPMSAYNDYRVAGVPANYLIDPKGRMVTQVAGWAPTLPERWLMLISDIEKK